MTDLFYLQCAMEYFYIKMNRLTVLFVEIDSNVCGWVLLDILQIMSVVSFET